MKKYWGIVLWGVASAAFAMEFDDDMLSAQGAELGVAAPVEQIDGRAVMTQYLQGLLAQEFVLYTKTLKSHWNIYGMAFGPLHELFGKQYAQLQEIMDRVAERTRALQVFAIGTLQEFSLLNTLPEFPGVNGTDREVLAGLLADHEAIGALLEEAIAFSTQIGDAGTNNMLSDIITEHQKMAWMLRSHVQ